MAKLDKKPENQLNGQGQYTQNKRNNRKPRFFFVKRAVLKIWGFISAVLWHREPTLLCAILKIILGFVLIGSAIAWSLKALFK